jgi:pimeloyl-ACP methyl ester carboxylesterase
MGQPVLDVALNAGAERVASDGRARAYVRRAYEPSGELERPLVSLHTTLDPVVPDWHEDLYQARAPEALFTRITVPGYGHCTFTAEEVLAAFAALVLKTGG